MILVFTETILIFVLSNRAQRQAQKYIHRKQRLPALHRLKQKKDLTDLLHKRQESLDTLDDILLRIDSAATDVEVMCCLSYKCFQLFTRISRCTSLLYATLICIHHTTFSHFLPVSKCLLASRFCSTDSGPRSL